MVSRYYDAETRRFLNKDDRECLKQNGFSDTDIDEYNNLYIYCYNNPRYAVKKHGRNLDCQSINSKNLSVGNIEFLRDFFSKQEKKRRNTCCISSIFKDVLWKKIQKAIFSVLKTDSNKNLL
ncbi:MAG: hypothetical protein FWC41_02635 [Firmicutes bacterium]|nr:hypothetical protein [Bacillota bacterium]